MTISKHARPHGVNCINILFVHFLYKILAPKFTKLCFGFEILAQKYLCKKTHINCWWNWLLEDNRVYPLSLAWPVKMICFRLFSRKNSIFLVSFNQIIRMYVFPQNNNFFCLDAFFTCLISKAFFRRTQHVTLLMASLLFSSMFISDVDT